MNKRTFLKKLNIVEAMLAFREGNLLRIVLDYYLKITDKIIILLDNYDKKTEEVVLEYKQKYSDKIIVGYSTIPVKLDNVDLSKKHHLNRRFKLMEGQIRNELLQLVHNENKNKKIDILLWGDADEIFTNHFPKVLKKFWNQEKTALLCNHIQMIDDFHHFHNRKFYSHAKAFKYRDDISSVPIREQCMLNPFKKYKDTTRGYYSVIHLADYNNSFRDKRSEYKFRPFSDKHNVWYSKKDIRKMSSDEYIDIVFNKKVKPIATMNNYLNKNYETIKYNW